jgi:hypothetical protein
MPPQNLHWRILGRPVKPVAFALAYSMLIIAWAAYANIGVLDGSELADILGGACLAVFAVFVIAWWHTSQRLAELGLLLSFIVWGMRFWLIVFLAGNSISTEGLWLSLGWTVIAGGSYLLEKTDSRTARGI